MPTCPGIFFHARSTVKALVIRSYTYLLLKPTASTATNDNPRTQCSRRKKMTTGLFDLNAFRGKIPNY